MVVTVWLFLHVMFGPNGMVVYRQKKAEYQNLQKEVNQLQKENDSANDEVQVWGVVGSYPNGGSLTFTPNFKISSGNINVNSAANGWCNPVSLKSLM